MAITIRFTLKNRDTGAYVDPTSLVLSDPTGAYGIKRDDTGATVVADGTAYTTKIGTGQYYYTLTEPATGLTYTGYWEFVYGGETHFIEFTESGSSSSSMGSLTWLIAKVRTFIGVSATSALPDSDITDLINDYYQNDFVKTTLGDRFESDWTQALAATDSGQYTIGATVLKLPRPAFLDNDEIALFHDKDRFWSAYPEQEDYITAPGLAIGSSDLASVANDAFTYTISDWAYAKAAAETALSGDTVPQSKYGAWLLSVDSDGTITVTEAPDNATGYATAALAINGLGDPTDSTDAIMGFVTVIDTDSTFIPGTTALNASGVTATYTDGDPDLRGTPEAVLIDGNTVFVRPRSDDARILTAKLALQKPTALSAGGDLLADIQWSHAVALGAAIKYLASRGDSERIAELRGDARTPGTLDYELGETRKTRTLQESGRGIERSF